MPVRLKVETRPSRSTVPEVGSLCQENHGKTPASLSSNGCGGAAHSSSNQK